MHCISAQHSLLQFDYQIMDWQSLQHRTMQGLAMTYILPHLHVHGRHQTYGILTHSLHVHGRS